VDVNDEYALSFGAFAGTYAALRPDWPKGTAAWLAGADFDARPKHILDLGAGTGKLTRTLLELGHSVVAADPSADMLDELRGQLPTVETRVGPAEQIPGTDDEFDVITVAQAWHWFDPKAATAECARVLKSNGLLSVAWHRRDEKVPWLRELAEVVGRMESVSKGPRAERLTVSRPFGPVEESVFDYNLITTPEGLRGLADTWSYVRLAEDREAKLDAVLALGRRAAQPDGRLVIPHQTFCYRTLLTDRTKP